MNQIVKSPIRSSLPDTRAATTQKFNLAVRNDDGTMSNLKLYFTVGLYEDGRPGEIFIKADKAGSFVSGVLEGVAIQMSLGLQYGIPLHVLVDKQKGTQFEPSGGTKNPDVLRCTSVLDLLARWLIHRFPNHAKPPE